MTYVTGPEPPRKPWRKRHRVLAWAGFAGVVLAALIITGGIIGALAGNGTRNISQAAHTRAPASSAPVASTPAAPAATPDPKGTVTWSCDEDLGGSSIYSNTYLTGEADLSNTGNIGIVVTVKFKWHQEAYPDVLAPAKTVRVRAGRDKVARFRLFAGTFAGSTQVLDRYDSWQGSHGGNPCHASVHIVSTFGAVQG